MKEYICKIDYYQDGKKFAMQGDVVALLPDNRTVVNKSTNSIMQKTEDLYNKDLFKPIVVLNDCKVKDEKRVNHPSYYTWLKDKCGVEVIDITRHLDFDKGNAIKYLLRAGYKKEEGLNPLEKEIEDLKKAIWYINDRIKLLSKF